ncbi:MAG: branched-chain amino acid ABC transporter permease [Candidatus Heimdallarchaeota archaeon]
MELIFLLEVFINGLLIGGIFALFTLGLNVIYGVMEMINFAHGEFIMLGMYTAYWLFVLLGLHPLFSLVIVFPALFVAGAAFEGVVIERIVKSHIFIQTFVTFGLLLLLQNLALFFWSADYRALYTELEFPSIVLGNLHVSTPRLIGFIGSMIIVIIFHLFLTKTMVGTGIRAVDENPMAAELMGINVKRMRMIAFGLGTGLAGAAGVFLSLFYYIYPSVGLVFLLLAFIIVVLGGMGSFFGSLVGGMIIGELYSLSALIVGPQWKETVALIFFIIILLFKPTGIFGLGERK